MNDILTRLDNMDLGLIIVDVTILSIIAIAIYRTIIANRIKKACAFRVFIIEECSRWDMAHIKELLHHQATSAYIDIYDKLPNLHDMAYSTKPLKVEYWLTSSQIEKLDS